MTDITHTHLRLQSSRAPYNRGGLRFLTTQTAAVIAVGLLTDAQLASLRADRTVSVELYTPEPEEEVAPIDGLVEFTAPIDQGEFARLPGSPLDPAVQGELGGELGELTGAIQPDGAVAAAQSVGSTDLPAPSDGGVVLGTPPEIAGGVVFEPSIAAATGAAQTVVEPPIVVDPPAVIDPPVVVEPPVVVDPPAVIDPPVVVEPPVVVGPPVEVNAAVKAHHRPQRSHRA